MVVSIAGNQIPTEILGHIFSFCPAKDNVKNTEVCKEWQPIAGHVAKTQLIDERLAEIESKAVPFLATVRGKLERYCSSYATLKAMQGNHEGTSFKDAYEANQKATQKHTVCIAKFLRVSPECPHISFEKRGSIAGRVFAQIHDASSFFIWDESGTGYGNAIKYLPIELFNLKVNDYDYAVTGDKNNGSVCFALHGYLIELMNVAPDEKVNYSDYWPSVPEMNRETAHTINLLRQNTRGAGHGHIWESEFYVAEFNASAESQPHGPDE